MTIFDNVPMRHNSARTIMTKLYGKHIITERTFDEQSGRMTLHGYWTKHECFGSWRTIERYHFKVVLRPLANGKGFAQRPEVDELVNVEQIKLR